MVGWQAGGHGGVGTIGAGGGCHFERRVKKPPHIGRKKAGSGEVARFARDTSVGTEVGA